MNNHIQTHLFTKHLHVACPWTGRAVGFLFHLAKQFDYQTPHELLQLVVDRKLYVELQQSKVSDSSVVYLNQVDSYLGLTPVKQLRSIC